MKLWPHRFEEPLHAPGRSSSNNMKAISIYATHAVAFAAILYTSAFGLRAADDALPLIVIDNVPLGDAVRNLARQSGLNYVLDPHVPGSEFGPGRLAPQPSVRARWTNMTARAALNMLLAEHQLIMVTNPATTVARIAPTALGVKPVPVGEVGTNAGPVIPLMVVDSVPLTEAIRNLARAARINVLFDAQVSAPVFDGQGTVSIRWERLRARQALAALLDNYGLVMSEDPATSIARITLRPRSDGER
jgi:hypothetical protein